MAKRIYRGPNTIKGMLVSSGGKLAFSKSRHKTAKVEDAFAPLARDVRSGRFIAVNEKGQQVDLIDQGTTILAKTGETKVVIKRYPLGLAKGPRYIGTAFEKLPSMTAPRQPIADVRAEAARLHVPIEPAEDIHQATATLRRVAEDSTDIFGSVENATRYLHASPLDEQGRTGVDLVTQRGVAAVLIKLDQMRFGFAG